MSTNDDLSAETYLQITEIGRKRLKRIQQHDVLLNLISQFPIGDSVFKMLKRMDGGDILTVGQLIGFLDKDATPVDVLISTPLPPVVSTRVSRKLSLRAIKRCVRKEYLARCSAPIT